MPALVMINGQAVAASDAKISVFDRGFLYGDSVFETMRAYRGVPFRLDAHLDRLFASTALVQMRLPWGKGTLAEEIRRGIELGQESEAFVRIMVTRGETSELGLDPSLADGPTRVMFVGKVKVPEASVYQAGQGVITYRTSRVSDGTDAAGAKVGNYLLSVLAMEEARRNQASEALIIDGNGRVLEGATSNVFYVSRGRLVTPPLSLGILAGITRQVVLELAPPLGLQVDEQSFSVDALTQADEVFITSSIREVMPVVRVNQQWIGGGETGPVTARLKHAFDELVEQETVLTAEKP